MTTPPDLQLDPFEARLLAELRRELVAAPSAPPSRWSSRRTLAAGAAVAATALVGVVLVPGLGTTPAYSVQEGNAGEIVVQINRPEDADGLEAALEEHGIAADITYLPDLSTCAPGRYVAAQRDMEMMTTIGEASIGVTLPPGTVRTGETFVLVWSVMPMSRAELAESDAEDDGDGRSVDGSRLVTSFDVAVGPVGPCRVVPAG